VARIRSGLHSLQRNDQKGNRGMRPRREGWVSSIKEKKKRSGSKILEKPFAQKGDTDSGRGTRSLLLWRENRENGQQKKGMNHRG